MSTATLTVLRPKGTDTYEDFEGYSVGDVDGRLTVDTGTGETTYPRGAWVAATITYAAPTGPATRPATGYVPSVDDMDGLPVGTIVRDKDGDEWRKAAGPQRLWVGLGPNEECLGVPHNADILFNYYGPIEFVGLPFAGAEPEQEDILTLPRVLVRQARDWLRYGAEDSDAQDMPMSAQAARDVADNLDARLKGTSVVEKAEATDMLPIFTYLTPEEAEALSAGAYVTDVDGDTWVKSSLSGKWRYGSTHMDSHTLVQHYGPIKRGVPDGTSLPDLTGREQIAP